MCSNMMVCFGFFYVDVRCSFSSMDIRLFIVDNSLLILMVDKNARYPR